MVLVKTLIEIAKIGVRYTRLVGRVTSGESAFVSRFPPHLRGYAKDVVRGSAIVFHGGLIADLLTASTGTTGDGVPEKQLQKTNKFSKKYSRRNRANGFGGRYNNRRSYDSSQRLCRRCHRSPCGCGC